MRTMDRLIHYMILNTSNAPATLDCALACCRRWPAGSALMISSQPQCRVGPRASQNPAVGLWFSHILLIARLPVHSTRGLRHTVGCCIPGVGVKSAAWEIPCVAYSPVYFRLKGRYHAVKGSLILGSGLTECALDAVYRQECEATRVDSGQQLSHSTRLMSCLSVSGTNRLKVERTLLMYSAVQCTDVRYVQRTRYKKSSRGHLGLASC
jgi:hypothetical protein